MRFCAIEISDDPAFRPATIVSDTITSFQRPADGDVAVPLPDPPAGRYVRALGMVIDGDCQPPPKEGIAWIRRNCG